MKDYGTLVRQLRTKANSQIGFGTDTLATHDLLKACDAVEELSERLDKAERIHNRAWTVLAALDARGMGQIYVAVELRKALIDALRAEMGRG